MRSAAYVRCAIGGVRPEEEAREAVLAHAGLGSVFARGVRAAGSLRRRLQSVAAQALGRTGFARFHHATETLRRASLGSNQKTWHRAHKRTRMRRGAGGVG